ncbi:FAD-dependent monooxygenase [Streptomyces sp. NPDC046465]|uniref:FAD-dependent oxidoreductase n=1 Tax=Streptomyces sp. NPDC046465 TaxID=3155810 RepID=UPI0033C73086
MIFQNRPDRASPAAPAPPVRLSPVADYLACMVGAPAGHPRLPPFAEPRRLGPAGLRRVAAGLIGPDWHPGLHRALEHWDTASLFPLRIATAAPAGAWTAPGLTLLGDAIHAMSPVLAMGANTALRDAGELTEAVSAALTRNSCLEQAVTTYQDRMRAYAVPLLSASRRIGRQRVGQR